MKKREERNKEPKRWLVSCGMVSEVHQTSAYILLLTELYTVNVAYKFSPSFSNNKLTTKMQIAFPLHLLWKVFWSIYYMKTKQNKTKHCTACLH